MPVHFYFELGGKPLVISIEQENGYKANFVLATICNDEMSQSKPYKRPAQNGALQRNNLKQNLSKQPARKKFRQQKVTGNHSTVSESRISNKFVNSNTTINENEVSPEIPVQNFRSMDATTNQPTQPSQNSPDYQGIRRVFFEPSQATGDHSLVVLAPDSDEEGT